MTEVDVASASMPLPKVETCCCCGIEIKNIGVFSGVAGGRTLCLGCAGWREHTKESDRG
jgi:hypothetical protein